MKAHYESHKKCWQETIGSQDKMINCLKPLTEADGCGLVRVYFDTSQIGWLVNFYGIEGPIPTMSIRKSIKREDIWVGSVGFAGWFNNAHPANIILVARNGLG